ncbi:unnamed protein product [Euphydryas editha]|uniref:Uncharacterized protein n=1 Tax=Euphydryas editha TaxID=104508 RepID=A0AAU9TNJ2_EUPED|nr:unnamed protein product [Euphydryas editha]
MQKLPEVELYSSKIGPWLSDASNAKWHMVTEIAPWKKCEANKPIYSVNYVENMATWLIKKHAKYKDVKSKKALIVKINNNTNNNNTVKEDPTTNRIREFTTINSSANID